MATDVGPEKCCGARRAPMAINGKRSSSGPQSVLCSIWVKFYEILGAHQPLEIRAYFPWISLPRIAAAGILQDWMYVLLNSSVVADKRGSCVSQHMTSFAASVVANPTCLSSNNGQYTSVFLNFEVLDMLPLPFMFLSQSKSIGQLFHLKSQVQLAIGSSTCRWAASALM